MKTVTTSALIFGVAFAFSGAALARTPRPSSHALPAAAGDADKKEKKDAKKPDCKHDKNHPCKATDAKSGQAK